jgi:hypothetical protein
VQRPPQVYDGATLVEWKPETAEVKCTKAALLCEGLETGERVEVPGGYAVNAGVSIAGAR